MLGGLAFSYWLAKIPGVSEFLLIEPFKINLPIIAAFLTIIGYSVNDTIVVFDRIREIRGKDPNLTRKMVNDATNQTLSRTIITSLTVFIVVVVLYIFGGQPLRGFSFATDHRRGYGNVQFDLRRRPDPALAGRQAQSFRRSSALRRPVGFFRSLAPVRERFIDKLGRHVREKRGHGPV